MTCMWQVTLYRLTMLSFIAPLHRGHCILSRPAHLLSIARGMLFYGLMSTGATTRVGAVQLTSLLHMRTFVIWTCCSQHESIS